MAEIFDKNILLLIAVIVVVGSLLGEVSKKFKLPKITGYILAGILIGKPVFNIISEETFYGLKNINMVALGLMSITIGSHLDYHKLKNSGKRVIATLIGESSVAFWLVFFSLYYIADLSMLISLLISSIAIATAPAATVAVVKDTKSKGLLINTIMPVVAMNNVLCILIFGIIANSIILDSAGNLTSITLVQIALKEFLYAAIIGITSGVLLIYFSEKAIESKPIVLTYLFITIFVVTGISKILSINSMLPSMIVGILVTNFSLHRSQILTIFEEIEHIILIIFFTLAGAHIDTSSLANAGFISILYFLARGGGKILGGSLGAFMVKAPERVVKYVGSSLIPQADVAIGLIIMASGIEALQEHMNFLTTLVLTVVALNEIFGPPLTKWSLIKGGDAYQDRPKLIEFLSEEYINPNIKATKKDEVIDEMIDFFVKTHKDAQDLKDEIKASVIEREASGSTGIGNGIAIPHGIVEESPNIWGCIGISKEGIEFDSYDNKPVHLVILVITPREQKHNMHLEVMAEFAKILSEITTRENLFKATKASDVCEILREKEKGNFNYFLDEVDDKS
ncbi:MAG: hypothetical protein CR982_05195 [Candidatus Cloacimonadota bacterium]|nr:MAG: hypothetical protein CR982_05195 [Candidatus Cloacimonadota bacterium]PIE78558.1 MAG: hypothetical protein CSA15_07175 [Candidatus Delongbacteria bacterium]